MFIFLFSLIMESNSSHNSSIFYNNPLFSCIITLYILIFLYFPKLIISPTLISTLILLLFTLRLGTSQQQNIKKHVNPNKPIQKEIFSELELETVPLTKPKPKPDPITDQKSCCTDSIMDWEMWGPLDVIYEAYEGEECDEEVQNEKFTYDHNIKPQYYPESSSSSGSSSGSSSCSLDGDFEEIERWKEDDEDKEEMFEIVLDNGFCVKSGNLVKKLSKGVEVFDDEDNLIEIDISPSKKQCEFSC